MFYAVFIPSSKTLFGQSSSRRNPCGFLFRARKSDLSSAIHRNSAFGIATLIWGAPEVSISVFRDQRRAFGYARPRDSLPALPSRESAVRDVVCTSSDGS